MSSGSDTQGESSGLRIYLRLLGYVKQYWMLFVIASGSNLLYAVTEPAFAWMMKPLVDGSFVDKDPQSIKFIPLMLIGIFLLRGVAGFLSNYYMAWMGNKIVKTLRQDMFHHLLHLPTRDYDRSSSGELISKLTFNVERVAGAATNALTVLVRDTFTVIALLALLFYHSWLLSTVFLVVGPIIGLLVTFVARQFQETSRKIQQSMGKVTHVVEETIEGNRVVKIFGGQVYEAEHFEKVNERNRRLRMRMVVAEAASAPFIHFVVALAMSGIIYLATIESLVESFSAGTFVSFITAMMLLFAPLRRLTQINATLQKGIAASESVFALIDAEEEPDHGKAALRDPGVVAYRDVNFTYDEDKGAVLHGIDFVVQSGQTVAFVGRSGSGKSTLVNLLARLYELDSGSIRIDDVDIREFTLRSLRDQIAYVGQEVTLFNDTVFNNIAYGELSETSEADVRRAAEMSHADEFIDKMPDGYQTLVGENGTLLSGGQRQRVAIARALLKNAPLLILDEATSALDTESERHVQAGLSALLENRTTFVIAHRLSTVEGADLIIVLDEGRIVESGSHAELLAADSHYAALHAMQFATAEAAPREELPTISTSE